MRADLLERLRPTPLGSYIDQIAELIRPAVRIQTHKCPLAELPLGVSRFGGAPDLPADFVWPTWTPPRRIGRMLKRMGPRETAARRLDFLGQLDLNEMARCVRETSSTEVARQALAAAPVERAPHATALGEAARGPKTEWSLPETGWLYFFYDAREQPWGFDPADAGAARVLYHAGARESLVRQVPVMPVADPEVDFPSCRLELERIGSLPDLRILLDQFARDAAPEGRQSVWVADAEDGPLHQLLGYPQVIQGPMELECQLASNRICVGGPEGYESAPAKQLEAAAADWQLLLQIDTDENRPGFEWGDCGTLYFWIRRQDLAARDFGRAWMILQCH